MRPTSILCSSGEFASGEKRSDTGEREPKQIGLTRLGPTMYVALITGGEGMRVPSSPITDFQSTIWEMGVTARGTRRTYKDRLIVFLSVQGFSDICSSFSGKGM